MCQYFRPRWWLVPNLLALDAPLVAVVWQRFLANQSAVVVARTASVALAATVWCIYLADRWLDARRGAVDADRHRIAARWPMAFGILFVVAASTAAVFAIQLPIAYTECGVVVGFGVGVYLALVHIGVLRAVNGAKEFLVGVGFAAGVAIPLFVEEGPNEWVASVVVFSGLCWLNCRLIDRWESSEVRSFRCDALLFGALLFACAFLPFDVGLAVAGSVLGLLLVHLGLRHRPRAARVLADFVLLTPIFWWVTS